MGKKRIAFVAALSICCYFIILERKVPPKQTTPLAANNFSIRFTSNAYFNKKYSQRLDYSFNDFSSFSYCNRVNYGGEQYVPHSDHALIKRNHTNFAIHVMGGSGLFSQLISLLSVQFLYENVYDRNLLIDESHFNGYRRNSSEGVLTGFFTPQMPVLDEVQQRSDFAKKWFPPAVNSSLLFKHSSGLRLNSSPPNSIEDAKGNETPMVISSVFSHKGHFRRAWIDFELLRSDWYNIYHHLIPYACNNFQFNEHTQKEINAYLCEHNIIMPSTNQYMVGFHVRRSDKVSSGESSLFTADTYLTKWIDSLDERDTAHNFTHCFVASDDFIAVEEFRVALDSRGIPCQLLTLTSSTQRGTNMKKQAQLSSKETLHFLAEISVLLDAEYFVGTMSSNVGAFVTLMRSCPAYFRGEMINNASEELTKVKLYNSIGVDSEWHLKNLFA